MPETNPREPQTDRPERRRHRLAVIGDLTADLAHHLNNLATSVLGSASLVERSIECDGPAAEHLDAIRQAARSIGRATAALQNFALHEPNAHAPVRFDTLVDEVAHMLRLPATVRLISPARSPVSVLGSDADLRHLVAAMLLVAREATEARGEIRIGLDEESGRCVLRITPRPEAPGGSVVEPLWGSEHSLAVIRQIAREHAAELTEGPAQGELALEIPTFAEDPSRTRPQTPGPDTGGGSLVLLQIRDARTRSLLATALAGTGFEVVQCSTHADAERTLTETLGAGRAPGAIVLEHDGTLPAILDRAPPVPPVPVVLITDPRGAGPTVDRAALAAVLTRPYRMADLVRVLAGVINDRKAPISPEANG
ncbi:MAG: hypothetical protein EA423_00680 [Phycisphaerales bacterium]|nr:MAG: hypothetical protein EA423_00680 [Phycisphaerales bacterium]